MGRVLGRLAALQQPWHLVVIMVVTSVVVVLMVVLVVMVTVVVVIMMLQLITRLFQTASLCPR